MKVALLHNLRPQQLPTNIPDDMYEEYDTPETIDHIATALTRIGCTVTPIIADATLPARLAQEKFDFAFNFAEGAGRRCREAIPAAICELLDLPFTGSDAATLAITLDKSIARRVVSPEVTVARAVLIEHESDFPHLESLHYPVLAKPNDEGSSKGIRNNSLAESISDAAQKCRRLIADYHCPVLVEEFLSGAEITVGIAGNPPSPCILGTMEIAPATPNPHFIYSIESKRRWRETVQYHIPPHLPPATLADIERHALLAYRLLGCRDIARIDFRLNAAGTPCFLECNPLPGLNAHHSDLIILSRNHIPYDTLIQNILRDAAQRHGVSI